MQSLIAAWSPIERLQSQFISNVAALSIRYADLAAQLASFQPAISYFFRNAKRFEVATGDPAQLIRTTVSFDTAQAIVSKLFPDKKCSEAVLIVGEELGWLWDALYRLPCHRPNAPGFRAPLYFLMQDVERLWVILHLHDWQQLLADERVRLFIGDNVVTRLKQSLREEAICQLPKLAVTVDPTVWPAGLSHQKIIAEVRQRQNAELLALMTQGKVSTGKIESRRPLRIMGITSRYTTFLQHSMRDWLAGLEQLGHHTRLLIEEHDHQNIGNPLVIARACAEYRPDLIVAIDHSRRTLIGVPDQVSVVMWVQDRLAEIYDKTTGISQGRYDYVIGYARQELTQRFAYPADRFMPAMVGVNDRRFAPRKLIQSEIDRFGCDISFVSHATISADQIIQTEINRQQLPQARALLDDLYQQLRAIYDSGSFVSTGEVLEQMIDAALSAKGLKCNRQQLIDLFTQKVNNAMFRHEAIRWAAELGVNLHLYGNGWENHPEFARFARGVADNQDQLSTIYQASKINLQVTPCGAVHQRLLDGLAAGGFFLLRSVTADGMEVLRRKIWEWCQLHQATSGKEMSQKCDVELNSLLDQCQALSVADPRADIEYFYAGLQEASMDQFQRTANTMWAESSQITFSTQTELAGQIKHFLASPDERRQIAASMRQRILQTHSYKAISKRMLDFIAADRTAGEIAMAA